MNDDQVKGRTSNISSQLKVVVDKTAGDSGTQRKDTVQQVVAKKNAGYGDLKSDLQRLWVVY